MAQLRSDRVPPEFARFISDLLHRYGESRAQFAKEAKLTPSQLSRLATGTSPHPPSILNCLRIAKAGRVNPSHVLRLAGHGDTAQLIESLYGRAAKIDVSPLVSLHEMTIVTGMRQLEPAERRAVEMMIQWAFNNARVPPRRRTKHP